MASEWISVEERLPDRQGEYLVYPSSFNRRTAWYQPCVIPEGEWSWYIDLDNEGQLEARVTHWMPIPEPPR